MCNHHGLLAHRVVQPVFMCQMAFVIPLRHVNREWKRRINFPLSPQSHFVQNFNAEFQFVPITSDYGHIGMVPPVMAYYRSRRYPNNEQVIRQCHIYFYLLNYTLSEHSRSNFALVVLVSADKICHENNDAAFYTPHDLVYLKRAMLDNVGSNLFLTRDMHGGKPRRG